jgi:hypothetical protein
MIKFAASLAATFMLVSGAAAAQDYPANTAPSPGVPGNEAVNPAPDAQGRPYLGAGQQNFYDPMDRERSLQQRLDAAAAAGKLDPHQVHDVKLALAQVIAEDRTQIARHGSLRDWDRERLNDMMNHIVAKYSELGG